MHCSKNDPHQIQSEKDLVMFIVKELVPLFFVEAPFLRRLILKRNPHVIFPSRHQLMNHILLRLARKQKNKFIYEVEAYDTWTLSFDLWMSKGGVDTFVLIILFLNHNWELGHVTIDLFETSKTSRAAMAIQVNEVLATYGLNVKILAYVKDEGNNISTMISVITFVVSCKLLKVNNTIYRELLVACNV
jgi:hypothetical protein